MRESTEYEKSDLALAQRLASLRMERALSLDDAAAETGISRATLSRIERGETSPTASTLNRLCAAYGLTMSALLRAVESDGPALMKWDDAFVWSDPETGFTRRSISPPHADYRAELIWGELEPGATVAYDRPPQIGLEHHVVLLSGRLEIELSGQVFRLEPRDCLRFHLHGPSAFTNSGTDKASYIVALGRSA